MAWTGLATAPASDQHAAAHPPRPCRRPVRISPLPDDGHIVCLLRLECGVDCGHQGCRGYVHRLRGNSLGGAGVLAALRRGEGAERRRVVTGEGREVGQWCDEASLREKIFRLFRRCSCSCCHVGARAGAVTPPRGRISRRCPANTCTHEMSRTCAPRTCERTPPPPRGWTDERHLPPTRSRTPPRPRQASASRRCWRPLPSRPHLRSRASGSC